MASSSSLSSPEEIREYAERLRNEFLEEYSERSDFDQKDIERVRNDIYFVENYVSHNKRHPENAVKHMVDSLTWRKTFGINEIKFDDIEEGLWRSGMAMNHGFDKNGHNVVILNISKHKKDSKKALKLQRWIAFSFEMQRLVYPKNRMCMVFDMNGAGLSNMDMDLVRFIINCFKLYFPDLLEWMLIFNMPWVLQAAWKIVQSWLSESGAAKVKFVTTETITEYIPVDNLLTKFGGNDQWEFDFDVERKAMLKMLREATKDSSRRIANSDDIELSETEEYHDDDSDEGGRGSSKQVRFSSGLPPTRQSRFGPEDDEGIECSSLPNLQHQDQTVLRKGTASSSGFRRRQVSRLMSLQEPIQGHLGAEKEANGTVHSSRHSNSEKPFVVGGVQLMPSHELVFHGEKEGDILSMLTLRNTRDAPVAYKVKTTAPLGYKVRPNLNIIDAKSVAKVQVFLTEGSKILGQDKFLVQIYPFHESSGVPKTDDLPRFWKTLSPTDISEHKMRCRKLTDLPSRPAIKPSSQSSQQQQQKSATTSSQPASSSSKPLNLDQKMQQLIDMNVKLQRSLTSLKRLNYVILLLLILLGVLLTSLINKFVPLYL